MSITIWASMRDLMLRGTHPMLFSMVRSRQEARLIRLSNSITSHSSQNVLSNARLDLIDKLSLVEKRLMNETHRLQQFAIRLQAVDPQILLKRGYSITLHQGKAVRDASKLQRGDEIETRVEHGKIRSVVQ